MRLPCLGRDDGPLDSLRFANYSAPSHIVKSLMPI